MVTLTAEAAYGLTGQYVARLTGREPKFTFAREFLGRKEGKRYERTAAEVDIAGLYETCDITKSGKASRFWWLADGGLVEVRRADAMTIARAMDTGRLAEQIVSVGDGTYHLLSPAAARRRDAAATARAATEAVWSVIEALPAQVARRVLRDVARRLAPGGAAAAED